MNWIAGLMNPTVVAGSVETDAINFKLAAGQTFKAGELVRKTSAGTIKVGLPAATAAGAVHGIALANAADYSAGDVFPIAVLNQDTILAIQLKAAVSQEDVEVGEQTALAVASNKWTVADSPTNAIATITGKPADDQWFDPDNNDASVDTAPVYVQIHNSVLQGRSA